jgi:flagellar assembly protein FliH
MVRTAAQRWLPPSFDPPIPEPEPEIVWPTVEEIEAIREAARREGFDAGRDEGFAKGVGEGFTQGFEQGLTEGRDKAYEEHTNSIVELTQTLEVFIHEIKDLPDTILEPITDLAWSIAERLSLGEHIDRAPFLHAVEEALMRLPSPGENLLLRVPPAQRAIWDEFLTKASLPFRMEILADADQESGAYIEVEGTRIDVGPEARRALVLMAMGLLPRDSVNTRDAADLAESS